MNPSISFQKHIVNSRVNIIHTVALKIQLHLCYKIISKSGLEDRFECGDVSDVDNDTDNAFSFWKGVEKYSVSWLKVNRTLHKPSYLIYVKNDDNNDPVFGFITNIIICKTDDIYILYKECFNHGFLNNIKCYEISLPFEESEQILLLNKNVYRRCIKSHVTGNRKTVVSRRDL